MSDYVYIKKWGGKTTPCTIVGNKYLKQDEYKVKVKTTGNYSREVKLDFVFPADRVKDYQQFVRIYNNYIKKGNEEQAERTYALALSMLRMNVTRIR